MHCEIFFLISQSLIYLQLQNFQHYIFFQNCMTQQCLTKKWKQNRHSLLSCLLWHWIQVTHSIQRHKQQNCVNLYSCDEMPYIYALHHTYITNTLLIISNNVHFLISLTSYTDNALLSVHDWYLFVIFIL